VPKKLEQIVFYIWTVNWFATVTLNGFTLFFWKGLVELLL